MTVPSIRSASPTVAPGEYVAVVIARGSDELDETMEEEPAAGLIVPPRYVNKATSGLEFTIAPGDNDLDVPLVSS